MRVLLALNEHLSVRVAGVVKARRGEITWLGQYGVDAPPG
jgi:hypothetical protein